MEMAAEIGVKFIEDMSRDDFHQNVIKGVAQKLVFGHLVSAGAHDLSDQEKDVLREYFREISPKIAPVTNRDFNDIATAIVSRSVTLR